MIDYEILIVTLRLILLIVGLTTLAAVFHKVHAQQSAASQMRFLSGLKAQFTRLAAAETRQPALEWIAAGFSGRWALLAAEEIAELELGARLDVIRILEERGVIARALRAADSRFKWNRARAVRLLGELRVPASVPVVLRALEDRDADVRNVAARALGRMKLQATDEALVDLLGKHEQAVSARIAAMCIEIGARTTPLLIGTLRDGTPKARFWAARLLGAIHVDRRVDTS